MRLGFVRFWDDSDISPGTAWEKEIELHLNTAQIILLLVSPDFIASDYCFRNEMTRAIDRHQAGLARVIPVLLRHSDWTNTPFSGLQMLPTNACPVKSWSDRDEAFKNIAEGIREVVYELSGLDTPDKSLLPAPHSNWQQQLTSSSEWQRLSPKAGEILLQGWQQLAPHIRSNLLRGWQQFSSQERLQLLQQWQTQYNASRQQWELQYIDEIEEIKGMAPMEGVGRRDKDIQKHPMENLLKWLTQLKPLRSSIPPMPIPSSIIIHQDYITSYTSPRTLTLLELEQIMDKLEQQDKKDTYLLQNLSFVALICVFSISICAHSIGLFSFLLPIWMTFIISMGIQISSRQKKLVRAYTDNRFNRKEELKREINRLKGW